jgi:hypothetical protein
MRACERERERVGSYALKKEYSERPSLQYAITTATSDSTGKATLHIISVCHSSLITKQGLTIPRMHVRFSLG